MALSLVLGGGTRPGFLSDVLLQLASVPLLLWSLWLVPTRNSPAVRRGLLFCGPLLLLPLLQLIPVPPSLWLRVPGRTHELLTYQVLGVPLPWLPISVYPEATVLSALSLIPPAAIFFSILILGPRDRRMLTLVLLGFGIISVFLGLTQLAQGPLSPLRFFEVTNPSDAVGFFANRNHYAALLYCVLVFTIAWTVILTSTTVLDRRYRHWHIVLLTASLTMVVVLVAGTAMARSRAGVALMMLALFGGFLLALRARGKGTHATPVRLLGGAVIIGALMVGQVAIYRILERFADDPLQDVRGVFTRQTLLAFEAYFPFGSGLGTFTRVYPIFEGPQNALVNTYVNRAHNDIVEFMLEGGVIGIGLMAIFALKLGIAAWRSWRPQTEWSDIDVTLQRAATVVLLLLALHSLVDYPLRTNAIAAVFALSTGLLFASPVPHPVGVADDDAQQNSERANLQEAVLPPPRKPWSGGTDWPEAWKGKDPAQEPKKPPR